MLTNLILVRHGNTFEAGEKVVWVGGRTDLPLAKAGHLQALAASVALKTSLITAPTAIYAGPLRRTLDFARTISSELYLAPAVQVVESLREIDYGTWEGLSSEEIKNLGAGHELAKWNDESEWPSTPGWSPHESQIERNVASFLDQVQVLHQGSTTLAVTSNGIMRFFARRAGNPPAKHLLKVSTGAICKLSFDGTSWHILDWNVSPKIATH